MHAVLAMYPYLFAGLLSLGFVLLVMRWRPLAAHRRMMIQLGLINVPSAILLPLVGRDYWYPNRLGGGGLGVEDALCAFNVSAMGCLPAVLLFGARLVHPQGPGPKLRRLLICGLLGLGSFLVQLSVGNSSMTSLIVTLLIGSVVLVSLRPGLWPAALACGLGFPLLYDASVMAVLWACPGFISSWTSAPPWGRLLFGIPLGETAWAAAFGIFWPLLAGYVFDLRLAVRVPAPSARLRH